nr:MAG TPA: hypothetical protein [Caudoviricetes sp.]
MNLKLNFNFFKEKNYDRYKILNNKGIITALETQPKHD